MSGAFGLKLIKFGLVGASVIVIDFSVTWLCKEKAGLNKYLANSAGFCCAVFSNFILNRFWTFEATSRLFTPDLLKFAMVSLAGLLLNNILLYLVVKYIKLNFYLLKLMVVGLVFFWNYFANFFFILIKRPGILKNMTASCCCYVAPVHNCWMH